MSVGTDDSRAPYLQVAADLRSKITSGELRAGDRLPGGRELAAQYGVALNTVSSALRRLKDEGLVSSQQGRGTFVRARPPAVDAQPSPEYVAVTRKLDAINDQIRSLSERVGELEALVGRSQRRE